MYMYIIPCFSTNVVDCCWIPYARQNHSKPMMMTMFRKIHVQQRFVRLQNPLQADLQGFCRPFHSVLQATATSQGSPGEVNHGILGIRHCEARKSWVSSTFNRPGLNKIRKIQGKPADCGILALIAQ